MEHEKNDEVFLETVVPGDETITITVSGGQRSIAAWLASMLGMLGMKRAIISDGESVVVEIPEWAAWDIAVGLSDIDEKRRRTTTIH